MLGSPLTRVDRLFYMVDDVRFDWHRKQRTGIPEVVFCEPKSTDQLTRIAEDAKSRGTPLLMTRLDAAQADAIAQVWDLDFDSESRTGILGGELCDPPAESDALAIVAAGTSDVPTAKEAQRCLQFFGLRVPLYVDVGVAGLWRLQEIAGELQTKRAIIAVAGMEGALFSVLGGLVPGVIIAVPSPVGYGVSDGGNAALTSALSSCSPGIVTVNIGNGFGAAAAAWKIISAL